MCGESCVLGHISKVHFPQSLPRALFHVLASPEAKELHWSVWSCSQVWFWPHNLGGLYFGYLIRDEIVPDFLLLPWKRLCSDYPNSFMFPVFLVLEFWLVSSVLSFFPFNKRPNEQQPLSESWEMLLLQKFTVTSGIYSGGWKGQALKNSIFKQNKVPAAPKQVGEGSPCPRCSIQQARQAKGEAFMCSSKLLGLICGYRNQLRLCVNNPQVAAKSCVIGPYRFSFL